MLTRPSSRRKSKNRQISLNLVPILDAMVTLIAFLLYTMSFLALVSIESPFPVASPETNEQKLQEKPLQLTVSMRETETEIWSPFEKIPSKTIPNPVPFQPDVKALHEAILGVKAKFPDETKVVIVPVAGMTYDVLIAVMDCVRSVEAGDAPIYAKDAAGTDQVVKMLFPEVVFGNLLGDS